MAESWTCPKCARSFTREHQRHACGTGSRQQVLRGRSPQVVATYRALEEAVTALGNVEIVARERYVLFRSKRIFADVVIMAEAVRLAIHLQRQVEHRAFIKVVADRRHVTHVAKLTSVQHVAELRALLKEAYESSLR
jgi:predicted transport protein